MTDNRESLSHTSSDVVGWIDELHRAVLKAVAHVAFANYPHRAHEAEGMVNDAFAEVRDAAERLNLIAEPVTLTPAEMKEKYGFTLQDIQDAHHMLNTKAEYSWQRVEHLEKERDEKDAELLAYEVKLNDMRNDLARVSEQADEILAELKDTIKERDELRAEIERLKGERPGYDESKNWYR